MAANIPTQSSSSPDQAQSSSAQFSGGSAGGPLPVSHRLLIGICYSSSSSRPDIVFFFFFFFFFLFFLTGGNLKGRLYQEKQQQQLHQPLSFYFICQQQQKCLLSLSPLFILIFSVSTVHTLAGTLTGGNSTAVVVDVDVVFVESMGSTAAAALSSAMPINNSCCRCRYGAPLVIHNHFQWRRFPESGERARHN